MCHTNFIGFVLPSLYIALWKTCRKVNNVKSFYNPAETVRATYYCCTYLKFSEQMQFNDICKKAVGLLLWL